jgi:hypothetical protein
LEGPRVNGSIITGSIDAMLSAEASGLSGDEEGSSLPPPLASRDLRRERVERRFPEGAEAIEPGIDRLQGPRIDLATAAWVMPNSCWITATISPE